MTPSARSTCTAGCSPTPAGSPPRYEQARALEGIARCVLATDPAAARAHLDQALALFREVESPDQHEVERLLAELG